MTFGKVHSRHDASHGMQVNWFKLAILAHHAQKPGDSYRIVGTISKSKLANKNLQQLNFPICFQSSAVKKLLPPVDVSFLTGKIGDEKGKTCG